MCEQWFALPYYLYFSEHAPNHQRIKINNH